MSESPFIKFLKFLTTLQFEVWDLVKLALLLGLFLYIGFAIMIARQVDLMSRALNGAFAPPLKVFAWFYLAATVAVFLLALVLL